MQTPIHSLFEEANVEKVTVFGAGNVGATVAFFLSHSLELEISLIDIDGDKARGVALDIAHSLPVLGLSSRLEGGSDPGLVEGSSLVIVTAGFARRPGMSRSELSGENAKIVRQIARECSVLAEKCIAVIVTNPVDEMTYLFWKESGFTHDKVMGMAGVLDTSRFLYYLKTVAGLDPKSTRAMVLGTHGDDMIPLTNWSRHCGKSLEEVVDGKALDECIEKTRGAGAEIVSLLKSGSAYYAPAVSVSIMARQILQDTGNVVPVSAYLTGEYGIEDVFIGVPTRLNRKGVAEVVELPLSERELGDLRRCASRVRKRVGEILV